MQIIREALNNAVKHARASQIQVRMRCRNDDEAIVEIIDNGVGLSTGAGRENHFGINIMRERTEHLGGVLDLSSQPGQGLRVRLSFRPVAYRNIQIELTTEARHA
jgi:nitrate/nitrite-specific signal transduction histidine kinase